MFHEDPLEPEETTMPFKSEKQRKYLHANKPKVAKKLAKHPGGGSKGGKGGRKKG